MAKKTYTITDFGPSDLLTNEDIGQRRSKVSSESSLSSATYNGLAYTLSGSYTVPAGDNLSMNITLSAPSIIHKVLTANTLPVSIYNADSTGTADGILNPVNRNLTSGDVSPTSAQLFYSSTPAGDIIDTGYGALEPFLICSNEHEISVTVENTSASAAVIPITVIYEEIGDRTASFGLTTSTQLEPDTEMSLYG